MGNFPDDPVPSYEESIASRPLTEPDSKHGMNPAAHLPLQVQLANTRTHRIENILNTYVDPLLDSQGAAGLYKTTFILVPSTVSTLQDAVSNAHTEVPEAQVVGFAADEVVKLIRLAGQDYAMEFWRQPAVLAELESSMRARLIQSGHRIFEPSIHPASPPPASPPSPVQEKHKVGFWSRLKGNQKDDVIQDRKLGWRTEEPVTANSPEKIPTGLVKVTVTWKDVSLRIANEMGLYESRRGPAVLLGVEVGT